MRHYRVRYGGDRDRRSAAASAQPALALVKQCGDDHVVGVMDFSRGLAVPSEALPWSYVERAYAGGARVFVEVGPAGMVSRLIGNTLQGGRHGDVPIERRGADSQTSLIRLLARLHAHRVPVDLSPLGARF